MYKQAFLLFLFLFSNSVIWAQISSFDAYLADGKASISQENYKEAIEFFKAAQISTESDLLKDTANTWIEKANDDWRKSLEAAKTRAVEAQGVAVLAKEEAEKQATISEANRLASLADIENDKGNHQTALYLSYEALRKGIRVNVNIPLAHQAFGEAVYRNYSTLLGNHTEQLTNLITAKDGTFLSCGRDKLVCLWNQTGELVSLLDKHTDYILDSKFSPDGQTILTCSVDKTAKIWNNQGQLLQTLGIHTAEILGSNFSPDGQKILVWSRDSTASIWNLEGQLLATLQHEGVVYDGQFSTDNQQIITRSSDNSVRLWEANGKPIATLSDKNSYIYHSTFAADGQIIVTCASDNSVKIWDTKGTLLVEIPHPKVVKYASYSVDSDKILTLCTDNQVRIWSLAGSLLHTLSHTKRINKAHFSKDGQKVLTASEDQTAKVWDLVRNTSIQLEHNQGVYDVAFSPNGKNIITFSKDQTAKVWTSMGELVMSLEHQATTIPQFSKNGAYILTTADGQAVKKTPLPEFIFQQITVEGLPALSHTEKEKYGLD